MVFIILHAILVKTRSKDIYIYIYSEKILKSEKEKHSMWWWWQKKINTCLLYIYIYIYIYMYIYIYISGFYLLGGERGELPPKSFPEKKFKLLFQILILFDDDIKESVNATNVQKCNFGQSWALSFQNFPTKHAPGSPEGLKNFSRRCVAGKICLGLTPPPPNKKSQMEPCICICFDDRFTWKSISSATTYPSVSTSMRSRSPTHCTRPNEPKRHPRSHPEHPGQPRNSHTDHTEKCQRTLKPIQPQIQQVFTNSIQFNSIQFNSIWLFTRACSHAKLCHLFLKDSSVLHYHLIAQCWITFSERQSRMARIKNIFLEYLASFCKQF